MINKQVNIANVKTMADGSIRLTIDVLSGDAVDFAAAFQMMKKETTMILSPTEELIEALTTVSNQIIAANAETH